MNHWRYSPNAFPAAAPAGHRAPGLLDLPGRPERHPHPAEVWSRHPLELVDEDLITGVGAATELPILSWGQA